MRLFTFFEFEDGQKKYLKTFFDISYTRNYVCRYIDHKTNKEISAYVNHVFIITPDHFNHKQIWEKCINQQCIDGYYLWSLDTFSNQEKEIKPIYISSNYPNKLAPLEYMEGFVFPKKYEEHEIFQFNVCEKIKPNKKRHYFNKDNDELIIENSLVSAENKTVFYLNN